MHIKSLCTAMVAATAIALVAAPQAAKAEVVLKAVTAFPRTNPLSKSFLRFVAKANKAGKGLFKIRYIGGPEITKPRQQPNAMRNGLFDIVYGPGPYYMGLLPEVDFIHYTTPAQAHKTGVFDMIRKIMKKKMNARFMGWFDSGLGLYLYTVKPPKRTPDGGISLKGLKMRSSPAYRDFIKALGGTPVVMRGGEVYTALERGTIQGMGIGLTEVLDWHLDQFVKYRISPPMTHTGLFMIMNQTVYDHMPKAARTLLDKLCRNWEVESRNYWKTAQDVQKKKLAAHGIKTIRLPPKAAHAFVRLFRVAPMKRMENNPKVELNLKKFKELVHYEG